MLTTRRSARIHHAIAYLHLVPDLQKTEKLVEVHAPAEQMWNLAFRPKRSLTISISRLKQMPSR